MSKLIRESVERLEAERLPQPWGITRVVVRTKSANLRDGLPQLTDAMVIGAACSGVNVLRLPGESIKSLTLRAAAMFDGPGAPVVMLKYRRPEASVPTGTTTS